MALTTYVGPIESDDGDIEFRIEDGSGDTAGMIDVGVYTHEEGDEVALIYLTHERAAELRDALTARLNG